MSECCKVGYSATVARAHVHNSIAFGKSTSQRIYPRQNTP